MNAIQSRRGAGWYRAGAIMLLLFGGVHLVAVYKGLFIEPSTPGEIEFKRAALALSDQIGPLRPTAWGAVQILSTSYSLLLFLAGTLNLLALRPLASAGALRNAALANMLFCAALGAVALAYQFPPPAVFALLLVILFGVSFARLGARPNEADQ